MSNDTASPESTSGMRLSGKVLILTGAAGNIGTWISRSLLREGASVVMTGRDGDKLEAFIETLVGEGFDRAAMAPAAGDNADPAVCRT